MTNDAVEALKGIFTMYDTDNVSPFASFHKWIKLTNLHSAISLP